MTGIAQKIQFLTSGHDYELNLTAGSDRGAARAGREDSTTGKKTKKSAYREKARRWGGRTGHQK